MVAIISNFRKKETSVILKKVLQTLEKYKESYKIIENFPFSSQEKSYLESSLFIITIGGDGTILSTLSHEESLNHPILPLHSGSLGFISSVTQDKIDAVLSNYLAINRGEDIPKEFKIERRHYLHVTKKDKNFYAFNDAVISHDHHGKLIDIETYINKIKTVSFRSDGLILSTATGSTAYNLASNGPILHPSLEAIIFNPICPHSLTLKPIVIPGNDIIEVKASYRDSNLPVYLILDGSHHEKIDLNEIIKITLSNHFIKLIKPSSEHYYTVLKEKMHWGR